VTAYKADTGQRIWSVTLKPEKARYEDEFGGGLAYYGGRLFVTTGFAVVFSLDAADGKEVWSSSVSAPVRGAPLVFGDRVFATSIDNKLHALAAVDGSDLWTFSGLQETSGYVGGNSPAGSGDLIVAPFTSGELVGLRLENGRTVWNESLVGPRREAPGAFATGRHTRAARDDRGGGLAMARPVRWRPSTLRSGQRPWERTSAQPDTVGGRPLAPWSAAPLTWSPERHTGKAGGDAAHQYQDRSGTSSCGAVRCWGHRPLVGAWTGDAGAVALYRRDYRQAQRRRLMRLAPVVANRVVYVLADNGRLIAPADAARSSRVVVIVGQSQRWQVDPVQPAGRQAPRHRRRHAGRRAIARIAGPVGRPASTCSTPRLGRAKRREALEAHAPLHRAGRRGPTSCCSTMPAPACCRSTRPGEPAARCRHADVVAPGRWPGRQNGWKREALHWARGAHPVPPSMPRIRAARGDGISRRAVREERRLSTARRARRRGRRAAKRPMTLAIVGGPRRQVDLLNRLVGEERMLTGPEAGITRDSIRVEWQWRDRKIRLIDTAGMRRRSRIDARLEAASVADTLDAIRLADVVVVVLDAADMMEKQDLAVAGRVIEEGRALVIAVNKTDLLADDRREATRRWRKLSDRLEASFAQVKDVPIVGFSALNGRRRAADAQGVRDLRHLEQARADAQAEPLAARDGDAASAAARQGPPHPAALHDPDQDPAADLHPVVQPGAGTGRRLRALPDEPPARRFRPARRAAAHHPAQAQEPVRVTGQEAAPLAASSGVVARPPAGQSGHRETRLIGGPPSPNDAFIAASAPQLRHHICTLADRTADPLN
jgi:small GTP-binding protein